MSSEQSPKTFKIELTEPEMQNIVYALSGFYNVMNQQGSKISPSQTAVILSALGKFKKAVNGDIILPTHFQSN